MKIEIHAYKITSDSGESMVVSAEEHDQLANWFSKDDTLPLTFATTNPLALYQTMTPKVPPQDPTPPGEPLS